MEIKAITNKEDLLKILVMVADKHHTDHEYISGLSPYLQFIMGVNELDNFYFSILWDGDKPAGFLILSHNINLLENELYVWDVFLKEPYRGKDNMKIFSSYIGELLLKRNADTVRFSTKVLPEKYVQMILPCEYRVERNYIIRREDYEKTINDGGNE